MDKHAQNEAWLNERVDSIVSVLQALTVDDLDEVYYAIMKAQSGMSNPQRKGLQECGNLVWDIALYKLRLEKLGRSHD